jgi:hypothetical protein
MLSRFLALFVLVGTTFAQTATPPTAATVEVWPEGKMPGKGAKEPEAEVPRNDGFQSCCDRGKPSKNSTPSWKSGSCSGPRSSWRPLRKPSVRTAPRANFSAALATSCARR